MKPEEMPEQSLPKKHSLWQKQIKIPSQIQIILCLFCVIFIWVILFFLKDYPLSVKYDLFLYLAFWSSVGSLIGFAVAKKRDRGMFLGAIIGAILAAVLMC
jgi:hypothetical protein